VDWQGIFCRQDAKDAKPRQGDLVSERPNKKILAVLGALGAVAVNQTLQV